MRTASDRHHPKAALIAVTLFLFFDLLALGLNFWMTWRIESQALAINLAGRQRMLSQRMVKSLLYVDIALQQKQDIQPFREELALTFERFDNTLKGFDKGHKTEDANGQVIYLQATKGILARRIVGEAQTLWADYRKQIEAVLQAERPAILNEQVKATVRYAREHNQTLLDLMNQLTNQLESQTQHEARQIRIFQGASFILALINASIAFTLYRRHLRDASAQNALLDDIVDKVSASVVVLDESGLIVKANRTAERMFGYGPEQLLHRPLNELTRNGESGRIGLRPDGSHFPILSERNVVHFADDTFEIVTIHDITRQQMTEAHLTSLAYHDPLTHLPNRLLFEDRLRLELAHAQRKQQKLAVMFLDLDQFKPVNDRYGHDIGDRLLREVAHRLQAALRETDTVARRGGDEFTLLINDAQNAEAIGTVGQKLIEQIKTAFLIEGHEIFIGCSIGIALFPDDGEGAAELVSRADLAMYRAKLDGRGRLRFYMDVADHLAQPGQQAAT